MKGRIERVQLKMWSTIKNSNKHITLYNIIFPFWLLMLVPPVVILTLAGNFAIDSLVLFILHHKLIKDKTSLTFKAFYKKSILKVWGFGFLADFIGALFIFSSFVFDTWIGLPNGFKRGISLNPFSHFGAFFFIVLAVMISGIFIYLLNAKVTFAKSGFEPNLVKKTALWMAILTLPWTFLLPIEWFY